MQQQMTNVAIPEDLEFSDLNLSRESDGSVSSDLAVIERICEASGLPVEIFRDGPEDNIAELIIRWYEMHLQDGGEADPVAEDLLAEAIAEEKAGQTVSHQPGRA